MRLPGDPAFRARMEKRSAIIAAVREFFRSRGFLDVETPIMVSHPGMEPNLDPFATKLKDETGRARPAYLITSPEYSMKKLLAAGFERIFEITKTFRDGEPWGGSHNPEFTMIEWYRANADYLSMMKDTEEMVWAAAVAVGAPSPLAYQGLSVDLTPPWPRLTTAEAFERFTGLDLGRGIDDPEWFRAAVSSKGCEIKPGDCFDDVYFKIFLRDIEPRLGMPEPGSAKPARPVILCEYPRSMAALARLKKADPRYAERFEAYCLGLELGNAFSELNDAAEQRRRLEEESGLRRAAGKAPWAIDEQFVEAVGKMPDSAGIAFGLDRLVMLLTDARDIRDVLFFPANDIFRE